MSLRKLPAFDVVTREEAHAFQAPLQALERWNATLEPARALAEGENVITMLDVIGEDFFTGGGVTSKRVISQLRTMKGKVRVLMNSPGGLVTEGLAIYNALRQHEGEVEVHILGMAASIASIIAMAGDRIEIARAGFFMIHNSETIALGDRHEMQNAFDWLAMIDQTMNEIYRIRSGRSEAELTAMMDRETFMRGTDAVDKGFADALLPGDQVVVNSNARAELRLAPVAQRIDVLMARAGLPRAERRKIFAEFKAGMLRAAEDVMPGADVGDESVDSAINALRGFVNS